MRNISLYWYGTEPNFGDAFSVDVVSRLFDCRVEAGTKWSADLVAEGSVLDFALLREAPVGRIPSAILRTRAWANRTIRCPLAVWGSGMLFPLESRRRYAPIREPRFFALRGQKTFDEMVTLGLIDRHADLAFGDPGLFMSDLIEEKSEVRFRRGFVMHAHYWNSGEAQRFQREHPEVRLIDPRRLPGEVVADIAQCSEIFSSSLHGLVAADSLGIPNKWVALETEHADIRMNMFKFQDYYSAFGVRRTPCEMRDVPTLRPDDPVDGDLILRQRRELEQSAALARDFTDRYAQRDGLVARSCSRAIYMARTAVAKSNYRKNLKRIRDIRGTRKIKVVFLVSEVAKWKGQPLFDLMRRSESFEPVIAVMALSRQSDFPKEELLHLEREKIRYFRKRNVPVIDIQHYGTRATKSIWELNADIVFYQQPWDLPRQMKPLAVSRRALTFYFPYYTPNYSDTEIEIGHKLHHFVFGYIVCNDQMAAFYESERRRIVGRYAGTFLPLGHPALDAIPFSEKGGLDDGCVIYAPHWTIEYGNVSPDLKYSTFLETGRFVLDYAKAHPEVKWAFKPHPALKATLIRSGAMSEDEAAAYYRDWERIGEACYSGPDDYIELFGRSRAMITDCGSFLTEYGCTGKPIIRLVNPKLNADTQPMVRDLYSTYYNVHDCEQLQSTLDEVVVGRRDPMRAERLAALKAANLTGHDAAGAIVKYLEDLVRGA